MAHRLHGLWPHTIRVRIVRIVSRGANEGADVDLPPWVVSLSAEYWRLFRAIGKLGTNVFNESCLIV